MAATEKTIAGTVPGLRRNAIGLREVLFQSITDMAPGAAIAASIPAGAALAGGSLPLSVIFALVACLLCAGCIGLLAREMPAAGSLATYAARGLHPSVGFLVAWAYVLVGWLIPPLVLLQLGFTTAATLNAEFHGYPANLWWPWSLAGAVIVLAAGYYGTRASAGPDRGVPAVPRVRQPEAPVPDLQRPGRVIYLYRRHPGRVTDVGLVHLELLDEDAA